MFMTYLNGDDLAEPRGQRKRETILQSNKQKITREYKK